MQQFVDRVKRDNPTIDWDNLSDDEQMLDVIKMSDLYKLTVESDGDAHARAYVIDRTGDHVDYPVAYLLFDELWKDEKARIVGRFVLTNGKNADERIERFVSEKLAKGFVRGGRAYADDRIIVKHLLSVSNDEINRCLDAVRKVTNGAEGTECEDHVTAFLRLSTAAALLEYAEGYLRDAARMAIDNLEGDPHFQYVDYEFDVDYDVLPSKLLNLAV